MSKPTVIDFFCGAGGFSEGFKQMGFEIVSGYDHWDPAVKTFNHNFNLNCEVKNILDYENCVDSIENLPDTDVIIGSPPCVSFSNSNKSGKGDKTLGIQLTEVFLRIVVVKKFKPNSVLKAWFMENVTNSTNYLAGHYNFQDLGLYDWAKKHKYSPKKRVISIEGNSVIINSAEYGSAQKRKRVITGELINKKKLIIPRKTNFLKRDVAGLFKAKSLKEVKSKFPKPTIKKASRRIKDPLYPSLSILVNQLTDHFYDTGLYECQWKNSKFMKVNHPYMGRMSFPENMNNPSRTITATNIGTSREAIIYKSEYNRIGDGEYRVPTVREMATLMGFPMTYQFLGRSESAKCRLVGNAVCPAVSRAFAKVVRDELGLPVQKKLILSEVVNLENVFNLNKFSEKQFGKPPRKNKGSKFRRHPFKYGNITVSMTNYHIDSGEKKGNWITSVQYGNGEGFPSEEYPEEFYKRIEPVIASFENGKDFMRIINNGFSEKIADKTTLQEMYESQSSVGEFVEPTELIENLGELINQFKFQNDLYHQDDAIIFNHKIVIPKKQVLALYAINKISTLANKM